MNETDWFNGHDYIAEVRARRQIEWALTVALMIVAFVCGLALGMVAASEDPRVCREDVQVRVEREARFPQVDLVWR